jgi:non-specific protein-tyrosine kinase
LSLRDYLQIFYRRKWLVIVAMVVIPTAVVLYSLQQAPSYRADAEVLLSSQNVASTLSGAPDNSSSQDADRNSQTQSALARVPAVAEAAIPASGVPISLDTFLKQSSVTSSPNSDLLTFVVSDRTPTGAKRLVNAYARAFASYREALDTASLRRARREVSTRLRSLTSAGNRGSALYRNLATKDEELRVQLALQTSHAVVVRTADSAKKVWPKPVRYGILGFILALILAVGLVFLLEALFPKVRSAHEIADRLKLRLLARLPNPPRHLHRRNQLVMLAEPLGPSAEAFRVLRTNLDLVNYDRHARTIMVTSAVQDEGKSTTIANLAVAAARVGRHVVLVDLDLRRGDIDELFGVANQAGITGVALGWLSLSEALVPIDINADRDGLPIPGQFVPGPDESHGSLKILPAGLLLSDVGDLVVSDRVAEILGQLRETADLILIDAPPFLQTGDAMSIAARVDAVVPVIRLNVRRPVLDELKRTLDQSMAQRLGIVVTGDDFEQTSYGNYYRSEPTRNNGASGRRLRSRVAPGGRNS